MKRIPKEELEDKLKTLIKQNLTTYQISDRIGYSQTHTSRFLNRYGLKNNYERLCKCEKCGEKDPLLFYPKRKGLCRKCKDKQNLSYRREKRKKIIIYLGKKCRICSFDKYNCSLDIHHLDPTKKDPNFKCVNHWSWDKVKKELEECILVCSNCHRAIHNNLINLEKLKIILDK